MYHKDIENTRAYKREEARRNKEQRKQYAAKRRAENYEKVISIERASRERNKEKNRPAKNARQQIRNKIVQGKTFVLSAKDLRRLYSQPCASCGTMENLSIDHIIPLSRGGSHSIGNMMTLCRSCNASKNARTIMEWRQAKTLIAV
jgi:5-methylcytosine-specific restriction endonuclease McrA